MLYLTNLETFKGQLGTNSSKQCQIRDEKINILQASSKTGNQRE